MRSGINERSIRVAESRYSDRETLVNDLAGRARLWPKPVVFVAGHFMLMYSHRLNALVPMVAGELEDSRERDFVISRVGDFPRDSLHLAVRVLATMPAGSARIAFLVNDHQFRRFQPDVPADAGGQLRRQFYRTHPEVLPTLGYILRSHGLDLGTSVLCNDMPPRTGRGILPRRTPYFSEYNLRNCFNDNTVQELEGNTKFTIQHVDGVRRVIHRGNISSEPSSLTDESSQCACSGEVMQFFRQVSKPDGCTIPGHSGGRPARTVVLLVPDECLEPVRSGIIAGLDIGSCVSHAAVISGLDSNAPIGAWHYESACAKDATDEGTA